MEQGGRRGVESVESVAVHSFFPHTPVWIQDRYFCFSAILPGPSPAGSERVWWRTGTLFNRAGVVPVRFNTVYALNRLHPTGLEPGLPAQYLADLAFLALHTVFPLRADKRVGSPA